MNTLISTTPFSLHSKDISLTVSDFWTWGFSDLLDNTLRGVLAEFLVSSVCGTSDVRINWTPYDCVSPSSRRIEVKSAAYLQSWTDEDFSRISFDIAPKFSWTPENGYSDVKSRNCDLFVFSVYTATSRNQSILNLDLWDFYILATSTLNREIPNQKKISLSSLQRLCPIKTDYAGLLSAIETIEL